MESKGSEPLLSVWHNTNNLRETQFPGISAEQEHEWRELLQKQLADHWLKLNYPEEIKHNTVISEKSPVQERESPKS